VLSLRIMLVQHGAGAVWTVCGAVIGFMITLLVVLVVYERCRRRTYLQAFECARPGTILVDTDRLNRQFLVVRLPEQVPGLGELPKVITSACQDWSP